MHRRDFLKNASLSTLAAGLPGLARGAPAAGTPVPGWGTSAPGAAKPDHRIRIGNVLAELSPGRVISTTGYNGSVSGEVLRLQEGKRTVIDIHNDTDTPEQLHWHGQFVPDTVDGAAEEGTPYIAAHGSRRIAFTPGPAGTRFYHTHLRAGADLTRGTYNGQAHMVYIEPNNDPGRYDREEFLMLNEFEPFFTNFGEEHEHEEGKEGEEEAEENGLEVGYRLFAINGKMLGHGEPLRVKQGERVLFHIVNASATENRSLALPGHTFKVVALDGNPVPNPHPVSVLELGVAERVDAIVEMDQPGVWILGALLDEDRNNGMGVVIEYAGQSGQPQWRQPPPSDWDYRLFGDNNPSVSEPDHVIPMTFAKVPGGRNGFNRWTVNGKTYPESTPYTLEQGKRYRLAFRNDSDDKHPLHLHRHSFELTRIDGKPASGVLKDVVVIGPDGRLEVDFVADHPGNTLFHCHQQLHMDYGFMALFQYA